MSTPDPVNPPSPPPATNPSAGHSGNALPVGHKLHEFEITGLVGEGGFGIVYLARDTQLQRTVAIKEYMPSSLAARAPDLQVSVRSERHRETFNLGMRSFVNEARLLASFDHPALIKVYRFWEENSTAYMVMPYYQGPTLKSWLREQPRPPDEAWLKGMLAPLLDALEVIHADHCYHRDIAPDNILLLGPNKPLLLDFGAARRVIGDATQALTVILKPGYAPVEQYAEVPSMKQGPWTDVYALCAVLYAVIMGKAPPPSVGRMMKDDLVPISQAAAGRYSPPFLAAIDAGLVVHPDQRLRDVAELRARLFATELPPGAQAPTPSAAIDNDDERTQMMPPGMDAATLVTQARQQTLMGSPTAAAGAPQAAGPYTQTLHVPRADAGGGASTAQPLASPQAAGSGGAGSRLWMALGAVGVIGAGVAWFALKPGTPAPEVAANNGKPVASQADSQAASEVLVRTANGEMPANATAAHAASAVVQGGEPVTGGGLPPAREPFTIIGALEDIVRNANPLMAVNTITDKSQLIIGKDRLQFQVKSSLPGYIYVYLAGTDKSHFYLLFPNALDRNNRIEADKLVSLPRKGWHITAGGPPGVNHIVTIVSPVPRDLTQLGLNSKDTIPEFDMASAEKMWAEHQGRGSPFVGAALCEGTAPCEQGYGASLVHIEEVAR